MELRGFIVFLLFSLGLGVFCQKLQDCCMNELCPYYCVRCDGTSQCFDLSDELGCSAEGDKLLQSYEKPPIFVPFVLKTLKAQLRKEKESVVSLFPNRQCIPQPKTKVARVTQTENTYNVVKEDSNKTQPVWSLLMKALNGESMPIQTPPPTTTTTTTTEIPVWLQLLQKLQAEQQKRSITTTTTMAAPTTEDWFAILKGMVEAVKRDDKTTLPTVQTKSTSLPPTTTYSEAVEESSTTDPGPVFISSEASEVTVPVNNLSTPLYIETTTTAFKQTLTDYILDSKDKNDKFDKGAKTNETVGINESLTAEHNESLSSYTTPNVLEANATWHSINSTIQDRTVHFTNLKSKHHANETNLENSTTETPSSTLVDQVINDTAIVLSNIEDPILRENNTKTVFPATNSITKIYSGLTNASAIYKINETIEETTVTMNTKENITGIPIKLQNDDTNTERSVNLDAFPPVIMADNENPDNTTFTSQQNMSKKMSSTTTESSVQEIRNRSGNARHDVPRTNVISVLREQFAVDNFTENSNTTEGINSSSLDNKFKRIAINDQLQPNDSLSFNENKLLSFTTESIVVGELIDRGINQNSSVESGAIITPSTDLATTEAEIHSLLNRLRKTLNDTRMLIINSTETASSMKEVNKVNDSIYSAKVLNTSELEILGPLKYGLLTDFQPGNVFQNFTAINTVNAKPIQRTTNDSHIEQNTTETAPMVSKNSLLKHESPSFPFEQFSDFKTHRQATNESILETVSLKPTATLLVTIEQPLNATEKSINSVLKLLVNNASLVNEKHGRAVSGKISVTDMPIGKSTTRTSVKMVDDVTSGGIKNIEDHQMEIGKEIESQLINQTSSSSRETSTNIFPSLETSRGQMAKNDSNSSSVVQVTISSLLSTLKESVDFLSNTSDTYNVTESFRKDNVNTSIHLFDRTEANASSLNQYFTTTQSEYDVLLKEVRRALNKTKDRMENIAAQLQIMENPVGKDFSANYETRGEAIPTSKDLFKYGLLSDSQSNDVSPNFTLNEMTGDKVFLNEVSDGNTVTESIKTNLNIGVPDNKPSIVTPLSWSYDTTTFPLVNFWDTITTQSTMLDSVWSPMPPNTIWSSLFDTWNFGTFGMPTTSKTKDSLQQRVSVTESPKATIILSKPSTTKGPIRTLETEPLLANANQIPVVRIQEIHKIAMASTKAPNISSIPYLGVQYDSTTQRSNISEIIGQPSKELATDANKETEQTSIKARQTTAIESTADGKTVTIEPVIDLSTTPITPSPSPPTNKAARTGAKIHMTTSDPKSYLEVSNFTTSDQTSPRSSVVEDASLKNSNQSSNTKSQVQMLASNRKGDNSSETHSNDTPQTSHLNVDGPLKEVSGVQEIHMIHSEEIKNKIRDGTSTINLPTQGRNTLQENWWDKSFKPTTWFPFETRYQTSTEWKDRRLSSRENIAPATTAANGNGCILIQDASAFCEDLYSGQHKNPDDCTTYFVCDWGDLYRCLCPPNTLFDDKLRVCNWNYAVTC